MKDVRSDGLSSGEGTLKTGKSVFELRAEITAYVELRSLADELNKIIVARLSASSEEIGRYTDAERAEMAPEMQILHRGLFLSFDKIAELQAYISEIVLRCNDEIDSLFSSYEKG